MTLLTSNTAARARTWSPTPRLDVAPVATVGGDEESVAELSALGSPNDGLAGQTAPWTQRLRCAAGPGPDGPAALRGASVEMA